MSKKNLKVTIVILCIVVLSLIFSLIITYYYNKIKKDMYDSSLMVKSYELLSVVSLLNENKIDIALSRLDYIISKGIYELLAKKQQLTQDDKDFIEAHKEFRVKYPIKSYNGKYRNEKVIEFADSLFKPVKKSSEEKQPNPSATKDTSDLSEIQKSLGTSQ